MKIKLFEQFINEGRSPEKVKAPKASTKGSRYVYMVNDYEEVPHALVIGKKKI